MQEEVVMTVTSAINWITIPRAVLHEGYDKGM